MSNINIFDTGTYMYSADTVTNFTNLATNEFPVFPEGSSTAIATNAVLSGTRITRATPPNNFNITNFEDNIYATAMDAAERSRSMQYRPPSADTVRLTTSTVISDRTWNDRSLTYYDSHYNPDYVNIKYDGEVKLNFKIHYTGEFVKNWATNNPVAVVLGEDTASRPALSLVDIKGQSYLQITVDETDSLIYVPVQKYSNNFKSFIKNAMKDLLTNTEIRGVSSTGKTEELQPSLF